MNEQRSSELMLCDQLRSIADVSPMSATTRTRLRELAKRVEMVERDRDALMAIVKGPITAVTEVVLCPTK